MPLLAAGNSTCNTATVHYGRTLLACLVILCCILPLETSQSIDAIAHHRNSCYNATTIPCATTLSTCISIAGAASCSLWLINLSLLTAVNSCCNITTVHCTGTLSPASPYCQFLLVLSLAQKLQFCHCPLNHDTANLHCYVGAAPHGWLIPITPDAIPWGMATAGYCTAMFYLCCHTCAASYCCSFVSVSPLPLTSSALLFFFEIVVFNLSLLLSSLQFLLLFTQCCLLQFLLLLYHHWFKLQINACTMAAGLYYM